MEQPLSPLCFTRPPLSEEPLTLNNFSSNSSTMEMSYSSSLQLPNAFLFEYESVLDKPLAHEPASDPGYVSAGSSLSPTSSVDSFCFSPASVQGNVGNDQDVLDSFLFSSPVEPQTLLCSSSVTSSSTKKSRSRYPGKKRQTASEREKLRMRDLTKALHQLRTYLPPSVAPAGQTLTKIETLRLTIHYISYLSAQLGLNEEVLEQRRSPGTEEGVQTLSQLPGQPAASCTPQELSCDAVSQEALSSLQHSYQVSSFCLNNEQHWMHQQQPQTFTFSGQC